MSTPTTLLPFQPATMSTAQLAAVSFLTRYSGRTHHLYQFQLREWCAWCERNGLARSSGSSGRPSSSTSAAWASAA